MVCLCYAFSCAIVLRRVTSLVERREASCSSERQVTHISLTHFTYALVCSPLVVCMIGVLLNCFTNCLDPSSV
jgi:hypothetical protein